MLSHEWRELETLCERISELRHRFAAAQKSKNVGLIDGLKNDLNRAVRLREQLVHHISARLGSATAENAFNANHPAAAPRSVPPPDVTVTGNGSRAAPSFGGDIESFLP